MKKRGLPGRVAWSIVDQGISSLTNIAIAIVVARAVSSAALGAFSIGFMLYGFATGITAALVGEPLVVSGRERTDAANRSASSAMGTSLVLGLLGGAVLLIAGFVTGGIMEPALLGFGVCLPGLLLQDSFRHRFFQMSQPGRAAANDGVWAALQLVTLTWAVLTHVSQVGVLVLAWGLPATAAAAFGVWQAHLVPSLLQAGAWLRENRQFGGHLAADFAIMTGAGQASLYVTGAVSGLAAAGALRGAQVLFGPLMVAVTGFRIIALPEGVRLRDDVRQLRRRMSQIAYALVLLALAMTILLVPLPDRVGRELMGASWMGVKGLLLLTGLSMIARVAGSPASFGLRALADGPRILRARRIDAPLTIALGVSGALYGGSVGAAAGAAVANTLNALVWWAAFLSSMAASSSIPGENLHAEVL